MNVQYIVTMWSQADVGQQYQWAQQIRFDASLQESDIEALIALYEEVLKSSSAAQRVMEEALITAMLRLCCPQCIPVFENVLFSNPPRGNSPLAEIVIALGDITSCTDADDGYDVLERCLEHPSVDVRDMATTALVRAYRQNNRAVPYRVIEKLRILLEGDETRRVRFSAGLALQELGEIDVLDILFWSEDMAGWEEDGRWLIEGPRMRDIRISPDQDRDIGEAGLHRG